MQRGDTRNLLVLVMGLAVAGATSGPVRGGLVSHFTFDETLEDDGPAGNDGVFFGDLEPFYVDGYDGAPGGAILLDGIDDYVRLTPSKGLPLSSNPEFSIALWVQGDGLVDNVDDRIFSESSSTENASLYTLGTQFQGTAGTVDFYVRNTGNQSNGHVNSTGVAFDGTWHHIAWVDAGGTVTCYIDGVADRTDFSYNTLLKGLPDTTTFGAVVRDAMATPHCCLFTGAVDDVQLYDHALTPEEVAALVPGGGCPETGDTRCSEPGLDVLGPVGGGPGIYTVTALDATDDSGDPILYRFTADDGAGTVLERPFAPDNFADFTLTRGTWTVSVTVDDDLNCEDEAAGATCSTEVVITCPETGDTHCDDVTIDRPADLPGTYTFESLDALDDSGDPIIYLWVADNGVDPPLVHGPADQNTTSFTLGPGEWTVSVTVDDDPLCDDEGATCSRSFTIPEVPPKLVSRWTFDGILDDEEASGNEGVFSGDVAPLFVEGFDGTPDGALSFDGVDDYVEVLHNENLPIYAHRAYTVALWVNGPPNQPDYRVFSEGSTLNRAPLLNIGTHNTGADGTVDIYIRNNAGAELAPHLHSAREAFDSTWHHIAWVDDGGKGVLYIDGVRDATDFTYPRSELTLDTTSIGGIIRDLPSHWFQGAIDDVRVYNYALSREEVEALVPEPDDCPGDADTTVAGVDVTPAPNNYPGDYLVTAVGANDATGDPILYTFTAESAAGEYRQSGPAPEDFATFRLRAGTWTITVTADDSIRCRDQSPEARKSTQVTVVDPPPVLGSHWRFDGDLTDSGTWGNDGTFFGGDPVFVADREGNPASALSLDGVSFMQAQIAAELPIYSNVAVVAFTVALWVRGGPQPDRRVYSESSALDGDPLFNVGTERTGTTGQVDIFIRRETGAVVVNHRLSQGIAFDSTWHHIAWVDDAGDAVLYIDGQSDPVDFSYLKPELPLEITTVGGILRTGPCCVFSGEIDDVRVYNQALTPEEVDAVFRGEEPPAGFVRGDVDQSGAVNLTDGVQILLHLFRASGLPAPLKCLDAADADDSGTLNLTDGVAVFVFLFRGGSLPRPSPETGGDSTAADPGDCGPDPTPDSVECAEFPGYCR